MDLLLTILPWAGWYLLYAVASLLSLWVFFLAVMSLARVRKTNGLNTDSEQLGTLVLLIGYLLDFNANVGVMTVLLLELPRETTVTARLRRHNRPVDATLWLVPRLLARWRLGVARRFEPILDPYDPGGDHI